MKYVILYNETKTYQQLVIITIKKIHIYNIYYQIHIVIINIAINKKNVFINALKINIK